MEDYDKLCPKFILNPHINPINNLPIADEEFDYYREVCKEFGYEFPPENTLELMYNNEYYGRKICKDFMENNTINPVTGQRIYRGTNDYNRLLDLCDYYKFDTTILGEERSIKSQSRIKDVLGLSPLKSGSKLSPISKTKLLPIPNKSEDKSSSKLLPIPNRPGLSSSRTPSLLPIPNRIRSEKDNILTNLKMIAREIPKDENVRKVVINSLSTILEKNADYDGNNYIMSGSKNKYGIKQFVLDLLINNEIDLIMRILKFFNFKYIDIAEFLFDFPTYANDESLIINYFINAPPDTDWTILDDVLQTVNENWLLEDKLKLIILLFSSAIAVGNDFIVEILTEVFTVWRESVQEEIDDIEDSEEEKDRIINLVEIIDTLSIR